MSGERTPKSEKFNSILRTPIALEEVNRILLRTTTSIKKFGNLGRNQSNVNSPLTLSKDPGFVCVGADAFVRPRRP